MAGLNVAMNIPEPLVKEEVVLEVVVVDVVEEVGVEVVVVVVDELEGLVVVDVLVDELKEIVLLVVGIIKELVEEDVEVMVGPVPPRFPVEYA